MMQVNEKLKSELLEVITKMDSQIRKFEEKRRAKIEAELKTNAAMQDKDAKIKKGAKKYEKYKQEIAEMWQILEASHNVEGINKLEDELKAKTKQVDKLKADVEAMERISKEQNNALDSLGGKNKENSQKLYQLNQRVREAKQEAKTLKE
jgi:chromosome segregation ATPase